MTNKRLIEDERTGSEAIYLRRAQPSVTVGAKHASLQSIDTKTQNIATCHEDFANLLRMKTPAEGQTSLCSVSHCMLCGNGAVTTSCARY
jgi:hypothetical protein